MNTDKAYSAIKNNDERGVAIAIVVEARKALKTKDGLTFKKASPQFTDKAIIFVQEKLATEVEKIEFSFDEATKEVTVSITPTPKETQ